MRIGLFSMMVVALSLCAGVGRADIDSEQVKAGMAAYDRLEYDKAVELLQQALKETQTRDERIATFRTLGFAYVGLDQPAQAKEAFRELLRIEPQLELDRTVSPRVRAVFDEARASMPPPPKPEPNLTAPSVAVAPAATTPPSVAVAKRRPAWKSPVLWGIVGGVVLAGVVVGAAVGGSAAASAHDPASVSIMLH